MPLQWTGAMLPPCYRELKSDFVAAMFLDSLGRAATAARPRPLGWTSMGSPDIAYDVRLVRSVDRTIEPGAEIFGFSLLEPSMVTGPLLLKLAIVLVLAAIAPTENESA